LQRASCAQKSNEQLSTLICIQGLNSSGFDASSELSSLPPSAAGKLALVPIAVSCQWWLRGHGSSVKIRGLTRKQSFMICTWRFDATWNTKGNTQGEAAANRRVTAGCSAELAANKGNWT